MIGIIFSTDSLLQDGVEEYRYNVNNEIVEETGSFEVSLTNLAPNTEYWYQAFLITTDGDILIGKTLSFKTTDLQVKINTGSATEIYAKSAVLQGVISIKGANLADATLSFTYGHSDETDELLDTLGTVSATFVESTGYFSVKLQDLTFGDSYWFQSLCTLENNTYAGKIVRFTITNENEENNFVPEEPEGDVVDLNLPSGTKWSSYNLGSDEFTDLGDYYAWAALSPHYTMSNNIISWKTIVDASGYILATSPYWQSGDNWAVQYSKYNYADKKGMLEPMDDVATNNLGESWRIPTDSDWNELLTYCDWYWYESELGDVKGYIVKERTEDGDGNSIFLPAGGYYKDKNILSPEDCVYWSSIGCTGFDSSEYYALGYKFSATLKPSADGTSEWKESRCYGVQIRPVMSASE